MKFSIILQKFSSTYPIVITSLFRKKRRNRRSCSHLNGTNYQGLDEAKIRRQDVLEVIKPRDHVFLGHQIPDCQVSANLREEIVRRAVKCTEKPSLVFDYHYRCVN